jgi:hypothetical protein
MILNKHVAPKIIFLSTLMFATNIFVHDALADSCCLPGCTAMATYSDPKVGTLGEMTDLKIYNGIVDVTGQTYCVEWAPCSQSDPLLILQQVGGDDKDVCVCPDKVEEYTNGISIIRTWPGSRGGSQDPANPERFRFYPKQPDPLESPCEEYAINAKSDDAGSCNVGDEQRTASATIKVWNKVKRAADDWGCITILVPEEKAGWIPVVFSYHVIDDYYDSNGLFQGWRQMAIMYYPNNPQYEYGWDNPIHTYYVVPQQKSEQLMYHTGSDCDAVGAVPKCSWDNKAYAWLFLMYNGGVKSEFYVTALVFTAGGNLQNSETDRLTLYTYRCCEAWP